MPHTSLHKQDLKFARSKMRIIFDWENKTILFQYKGAKVKQHEITREAEMFHGQTYASAHYGLECITAPRDHHWWYTVANHPIIQVASKQYTIIINSCKSEQVMKVG